MADLAALRSAIARILGDADTDTQIQRVCAAVTAVAPADGAALTAMTSDSLREPLFASDEVMARFEQEQFNMGEGPILDAFTTSRPVLLPDMARRSVQLRWPTLIGQAAYPALESVFCFPVRVGAIRLGVFTLYRNTPHALEATELATVLAALEMLTNTLLHVRASGAGRSLLDLQLAADDGRSRHVGQATGMLIVQLDATAEVAFARLRAHAYTEGRDIEQVAIDVVQRRLRLEADPA